MHKKPWFDEYGYIQKKIPKQAVKDCAHIGPCEDDVTYWQEKLQFMAPRKQMIDYLQPFGGWDSEELNAKSDVDLAQIVLWIACGDLKENGEWFGLVH